MLNPMMTTSLFLISILLFLSLFTVPNVADYVLFSDPPESFIAGQNLTYDMTPHGIPFGPEVLSFESDCNIVLYNKGERAWATNTSRVNGKDCYLTLLPDGELILRHDFHYPLWSSGKKSNPGSYAFILRWDGTLGVFGPELWSNTNDVVMSDPEPIDDHLDYVVYSYQVTPANYGILSTYKNFELKLTEECNLVLKDLYTEKILWQTNTSSTYRDCFTYLDEWGELFIKYNRRDILWRTGKRAAQPAVYPQTHAFVLRYDGRLVIYDEQIWSIEAATKGGLYSRFIS